MSYGRNYSPYREPCAGSLKSCFGGAKYQNNQSNISYEVWENITAVEDTVRDSSNNPVSGAGVAPYTRLDSTANPCTGLSPDCGPVASQNWGFCDQWSASDILSCPTYPGVVQKIEKNCYRNTGTHTKLAKCRHIGFQNLLAFKMHQGSFGPASTHWNHPEDFCFTGIVPTFSIIPERTTADQTKYLTCILAAAWHTTDSCGTSALSTTYDSQISVNRYSGERSLVGCSMPDFTGMPVHSRFGTAALAAEVASWNLASLTTRYLTSLVSSLGETSYSGRAITWSRSGYSWTATIDNSSVGGTSTDPYAYYIVDPAGGSFSEYKYLEQTGPCPIVAGWYWGLNAYEVVTVTGSSIALENFYNNGNTSEINRFEIDVTFQDEYYASEVDDDVRSLLALWNLDDLDVYPPRSRITYNRDGTISAVEIDERVGQAPMVYFNEFGPQGCTTFPNSCTMFDYRNPTAGSGTVIDPYTDWSLMGWQDENIWEWVFPRGQDQQTSVATTIRSRYDGRALGAPNPAGTGPHFDFDHVCVDRCEDPLNPGNYIEYDYGYGAWNPSDSRHGPKEQNTCFPPCATKWTNISQEAGNQWGKYAKWSQGVLYFQQYREIKLPLPSQDYARPYGADRQATDERNTGCIYSETAGVLAVEFESTPSIVAGDYVYIDGLLFTPGLYQVTLVAGPISGYYNYTMGARIRPLIGSLGNGEIFGKARWKDCPGFGGNVSIKTAVQNVDGVTLDVELNTAVPYLITGDSIQFSGVSIPAGTYSVTVVDSTHIQVTATITAAYISGGLITCVGNSPHVSAESWVDNRTKGDWCLATFVLNNRDYQERDRVNAQYIASGSCASAAPADSTPIRNVQESNGLPRNVEGFSFVDQCTAFSPCLPMFMELPDFPGLNADETYGAEWQCGCFQFMYDIFYQTPHKDCDIWSASSGFVGWSWRSDSNGSCSADAGSEYFYPISKLVEARATIPSGSYTLPSGVKIGVAPLSDLQLVTPITGLPALGPYSALGYNGAYPGTATTIWGITMEMCLQLASGGCRFASDYSTYDLPC